MNKIPACGVAVILNSSVSDVCVFHPSGVRWKKGICSTVVSCLQPMQSVVISSFRGKLLSPPRQQKINQGKSSIYLVIMVSNQGWDDKYIKSTCGHMVSRTPWCPNRVNFIWSGIRHLFSWQKSKPNPDQPLGRYIGTYVWIVWSSLNFRVPKTQTVWVFGYISSFLLFEKYLAPFWLLPVKTAWDDFILFFIFEGSQCSTSEVLGLSFHDTP